MTWWGWVRRTVLGLDPHRLVQFDATPKPIDRAILEWNGGGASVSRSEALSVPAVAKGRNLICSVSTLPLVERGPGEVVIRSPLLEQFDPNVPNVVHMSMTLEDLLMDAVAWWRVLAKDSAGFPVSVTRVDPSLVTLKPPHEPAVAWLPSGQEAMTEFVWINGERVHRSWVIRFDSPNGALRVKAAASIRRALRYLAAADMYATNPQMTEYFRPADGSEPIDDDVAAEHISAWRAARKRGGTAWIPRSMEYVPSTAPTAADMKLVELQQRVALDVANHLGVDPEVLGISTTSRTYANAQDWRRDRINDVYAPYMAAISQRLSMGDVTRRGYYVAFDLDDYMRANPTERWGVYSIALDKGVMSVPEIRAEEGLPADGAPVAPAAPAGDAPVTPAPDDELAARRGRAATFDTSPRVVEFSTITRNFNIDAATRTIRGTALPWSEIASKFGVRFRFERGALQWSDDIGRVKMLRDHDFQQPLGRATALTTGDAGLEVAFSIARGAEGDRAIELAQDGVLDGMSVGVEFDEATDTVPDPDNEGVILIRRATLREVSLTAMPAFDSARVTTVAASRDQNQGEPMTTTAGAPAPVAAPAAPTNLTLDAGDRARLLALLTGGTPAATPEPGPTPVDPAGPNAGSTGPAAVNEPEPYRLVFDRRGVRQLRPGSHDFSTDLVASAAGDVAASQRVQHLLRVAFDTDRADVATLNPNRQRPDLYVDQRQYRYPVWESISKGTLADSTPFVVPKFSSASGLVGTHTEGVEPTAGVFTATSQTVTPTAVSGKVEITREAWDQGGNPQMSGLIWRQMERAWWEALEARAIAVFDAATPTAIALTAGGGTTGQTLAAELIAAIARLQFIRGGLTMTDTATQVDLYVALAGAQDDAGRPLFPMYGPQNANGQSNVRLGSIDVGGILFHPSWALAATGAVVASSYLYDRESVHGWASAPQRLQFEYRVAYVDLAIWGYGAAAITDVAGVREITYDPVA
jgi:HK97 family phage prohead protease